MLLPVALTSDTKMFTEKNQREKETRTGKEGGVGGGRGRGATAVPWLVWHWKTLLLAAPMFRQVLRITMMKREIRAVEKS